MMQLWKLHIKAHTHTHTPHVIDNTEQSTWYYTVPYVEVLYLIDYTFDVIRREPICCVCTTSSGVIWPLLPRKGGMLRETPRGRRSCTVNPLSAITESPLAKGKFRNPERITISLSEIWPVYSWLMNVIAPPGEMPTRPFRVVWFLYELKSSLFKRRLLAFGSGFQYSQLWPW